MLDKEEKIKCHRRYDNFDKFYNKLKKKYPYYLIPKLAPKNSLTKILSSDDYFYENRKMQLNYFLNYLCNHDTISHSKDFTKFVNETEFDEEYFTNEENILNDFPFSLNISSDNIKNKIFGVFSGIFGKNENLREISNEEILLKKMETHYKGLLEKYKGMKENIINYIKSLKISENIYRNLANACFYLKDSLVDVDKSLLSFKAYNELTSQISQTNRENYYTNGLIIEIKFEVKYKYFYLKLYY
jgi:hypothetical protein